MHRIRDPGRARGVALGFRQGLVGQTPRLEPVLVTAGERELDLGLRHVDRRADSPEVAEGEEPHLFEAIGR